MTAIQQDPPDVTEADGDDLRRAVKRTLRRSGYTFAQLAEQAKSGNFETLRARLAWVAIGDLGYLVD